LFTKNDGKNITIILVYVDDLIITENSEKEIRLIKAQLRENFDIKDLGYLKYFLGIEVVFSRKDLFYFSMKIYLGFIERNRKVKV
jgi:Reverse transcriptase (RNA-dependent DNA polymerase)